MIKTKHYDAIVVGASQAGGPLSTTLAGAGWKTALVEREHVGGSCINYGCTPTETMVANAGITPSMGTKRPGSKDPASSAGFALVAFGCTAGGFRATWCSRCFTS